MNSDCKIKNNLASGFWAVTLLSIAFFLAFIYAVIKPFESQPMTAIWGSNTKFYIISLLLFVGVFLILRIFSYLLPYKWGRKAGAAPVGRVGQIILSACIGIGVASLAAHRTFVAENSEFGVDTSSLFIHQLPAGLVLLLLVPTVAVFLYLSRTDFELNTSITYLVYFIVIVCSFFSLYMPNMRCADVHHGVAYTETIFNVLHGIPYDINTTGIYGHYGLFYAPILFLLGGKTTTLIALIGCVGALSSASAIYVIHNILPKNWMRIAGAMSVVVSTAVMRDKNYWQVQPHRVLFPLLLTAYVLFLFKKHRTSWNMAIIGYAICTLGIIWNTESGIFCSLAFTYALLIHDLQTKKWHSIKELLRIAVYVILVLLSVLAAIGIVNLYNLLNGGQLIFATFFFPLFESSYMVGALSYALVWGNHAWIAVLILGCLLIALPLKNTTFFAAQDTHDSYAPVLGCVGALILMNFSYYANRAAYFNLDICYQLCCIGICLLWQRYLPCWSQLLQGNMSLKKLSAGIFSGICMATIICLSLQCAFIVPNFIRKNGNKLWNVNDFEMLAQELAANVPEDTFAFGSLTTAIYQQLGWDTQLHIRDFSDLYAGGSTAKDYLVQQALQHDRFLVSMVDSAADGVLQEILQADSSYQLESEFVLQDQIAFQIYSK